MDAMFLADVVRRRVTKKYVPSIEVGARIRIRIDPPIRVCAKAGRVAWFRVFEVMCFGSFVLWQPHALEASRFE